MNKTSWLIFLVLIIICQSCKQATPYKTDIAIIEKGQKIFEMHCAACHNFKSSGIGPNLTGVTSEVPYDSLKSYIRNPKEKIEQGNERAKRLFEEYMIYMPNFNHLSDPDMEAILAYIHTQENDLDSKSAKDFGTPLQNPIPDTILNSGKTLQLKLITQVPATAKEKPIARINKILSVPGSQRIFINDLNGVLYELKKERVEPVIEISDHYENFINKPGLGSGLGSFAFHPEYLENGLFYTSHTEEPDPLKRSDFSFHDSIPKKLTWILTEWNQENPDKTEFSGTKRELLRVDMVTQIHGMQEITFNPTAKKGEEDYSKLYISIGDGGSVGSKYLSLTQDSSKIWGSILRIDPSGSNSKNRQYGIPKNNPFFNDKNALGEIWAFGFRNPHRITWDSQNGNMLASEIGQHNIEELNLIEKGKNYGWPKREGKFKMFAESDLKSVYALDSEENDGFAYPVAQFDHDEANAICGGFVYYGKAMPELQGKYIFGSIVKGRLFMLNAEELQLGKQAVIEELNITYNGSTTLKSLTESERVDFRIGIDTNGELIIFTKSDGKIYKVTGIK